ncbi:MAG: tRNA lysidine(34) synthetase TilS [Candidatus Improbicoccus pseudotrichonymphae]|uniref:tRNA(Ile)-lysidine synthase n=1 Tax=Candidatus Improbicoccus pseudotrichonymphae TaxID=3033792 RepID=A0AA48I368_9FIRM|nr:MAG: tRNA lysidine(34) synthetase TilS [Candidatus Improbicoccus pseudotrichonymphae]
MFETKVISTIRKFRMFENLNEKNRSLFVAVSGGIDSMSLLHFLINNYSDIGICVVHINHNLRGNESLRDELFVRTFCEKNNMKLIVKQEEVGHLSKKNKIGVEECARNVRYGFFDQILKNNIGKLATAHSLSDSLETIIFNFIRGTGLNGLQGIYPIRDNFIRPFIEVTKNEIKNYATENKIDFVEDSSNSCTKYSRNKIRRLVFPVLQNINPSFEKNGLNFIEQMSGDNSFLDQISDLEFKKLENDFDVNLIKNMPYAIKTRVLKKILKQFLGNFCMIEYKQIKLLLNLIENSEKTFTLPSGNLIFITEGKIMVDLKKRNKVLPTIKNKFRIIETNMRDVGKFGDDFVDMFDIGENVGNYVFRNRLPGDCFRPKNRNCTKVLRKFFNEIKISVEERNNLTLLGDKNKIVWIENIGVSEDYRVGINTKKVGIILRGGV